MPKSTKQPIGLAEFIEQVKQEVLDYQTQHEGEEGMFQIEGVNLEITLGAIRGGGGTVKLAVVELGGDIKTEHTHKVQLQLSVFEKAKQSRSKRITKAKVKKKTTAKRSVKRPIKRGGRALGP